MPKDLEKLYQEIILDHYRNPRNSCTIPEGSEDAERLNPACGDRVRLKVWVDGKTLCRIEHDASGCAVCRASASLMADRIQNVTVSEALIRSASILDLLQTGEGGEGLDELGALRQIREFPLRVRCATLPWLALQDALQKPSG